MPALQGTPNRPFDMLIVEDDACFVAVIKAVTSELRKKVKFHVFDSSEQAESYLEDLRVKELPGPDLALIDFYLKGSMNGLWICKLLESWFPSTKVIVASQAASDLMTNHMHDSRVDAHFVQKPLSISQLIDVIKPTGGEYVPSNSDARSPKK